MIASSQFIITHHSPPNTHHHLTPTTYHLTIHQHPTFNTHHPQPNTQMNHKFLLVLLLSLSFLSLKATDKGGEEPVDLVNPFIGTSNFGTTNPGAVCPNGLMSVVPFNVMGSDLNKYDKDARWWSTPYRIS